ncbi:lasso peptide biosynthesis B2 protein [Streptomyces sp. NPDC001262]|uniref:lasso peptide biosynthesis B2 protein n=1 Tax=Streptomyces sp. NPDC001262 TaxID=3364552 RepID=UPI003690BCEA
MPCSRPWKQHSAPSCGCERRPAHTGPASGRQHEQPLCRAPADPSAAAPTHPAVCRGGRLGPADQAAAPSSGRRPAAGARPGPAQTSAARTEVIAVSLRCAVDGCLQLSTATALLCRMRGAWPTWRVGVRTTPFAAHSWVEADGQVIDEPLPDGYYQPLMTIAPLPAPPDHGEKEKRCSCA